MLWSSLLGRGALSVMMLMFSGECTSLVQNVWSVSGDHRAESERAARVFRAVQAPFTYFYTAARVVAGPGFLFFVVKARLSVSLPSAAAAFVRFSTRRKQPTGRPPLAVGSPPPPHPSPPPPDHPGAVVVSPISPPQGVASSPHLSLVTRATWSTIAVVGCCGSWGWVRRRARRFRPLPGVPRRACVPAPAARRGAAAALPQSPVGTLARRC